MANISIDTTTAGYQNRLTQLQDIKTFYGPRIVEYLAQPPERQKIWRNKDPILWELLDIWRRIEAREESDLD